MSNSKELATSLGAYLLSKIEDLEGDNFFLGLVKAKLPNLRSRWICLLKKLFVLLTK
jgi:hypothetical protein